MKKLASCLLCITAACLLRGQTPALDSLRAEFAVAEDSVRVMLLYHIGEQFLPEHPDSAFHYGLEGLTLARSIGHRKGEMMGLGATGNVLNLTGNFPAALKSQLEALTIAEELKDYSWMAEIYGNIARVYFFQKDYPQALAYLGRVKKVGQQMNDKDAVGDAMENQGAVYIMTKQFDSALICTQQAYSLAVERKKPVFNMLLNMGHIYHGQGQWRLALEYFRSAMPDIDRDNNPYYKCEALLGMAKVFHQIGQRDSSLIYSRNSFIVARNAEFLQGSLDAAEFLTGIYRYSKNADSAFFYSQHAKDANDSLYSQQKVTQVQSLTLAEQLRQRDREEHEREAREDRKHNLQYAAIAIGLIFLLVVFLLLSQTIIVNQSVIRFLAALSLLIFFEFINLLIHPFIAGATHHSPVGILSVMVCVAAMLIPLHHKIEHWLTHRLIEKNNRIRLAAARKTIAELEGPQPTS